MTGFHNIAAAVSQMRLSLRVAIVISLCTLCVVGCGRGGSSILTGGGSGAPQVISLSPNSGTTAGGTNVTITGAGFTSATGVTFGGTAASGFAVVSATQIVCATPAHAAGAVTVAVTGSSGSGSLPNGFTYTAVASAPTVSFVTPSNGQDAGGTNVSITGTNLTGATSVTLGGSAATNVSVVSATQITCTTPAHAQGAVSVAVTTAGGTGTLPNGYFYDPAPAGAPVVTTVNPLNGPEAGGTNVTITGTDFTGATSVTFGGTAASSVVVVSALQITCTTSAHAPGAVDVTVTTPVGSGSLPGGFTYDAAPVGAPTVTTVTPDNGPDTGGTNVTITGTDFTAATGVTFGGTAATNLIVTNGGQLTCTTPAHAPGPADVAVTTAAGTGALPGGFTFISANAPIMLSAVASDHHIDAFGHGNIYGAQTSDEIVITFDRATNAFAVTTANIDSVFVITGKTWGEVTAVWSTVNFADDTLTITFSGTDPHGASLELGNFISSIGPGTIKDTAATADAQGNKVLSGTLGLYVRGDVDSDGGFTFGDIQRLIQYCADPVNSLLGQQIAADPDAFVLGDVNRDGVIDVNDYNDPNSESDSLGAFQGTYTPPQY